MQTSKGPYLRVSHTIKENPMEDGVQWIRLPYLVGEKCLDKSTGKVVTVLSCEPIRVSEVTEEDAIKMGAYWWHPVDDFIDQWHKRHPDKEWAWRVESEEEN